MKKCFLMLCLTMLISIAHSASAANFNYTKTPIGSNQYEIQINSDTPQSASTFFDALSKVAQDVCGGAYRVLEINPETTHSMTSVIACQSAQQAVPAPTPTTRAPIAAPQYSQPAAQSSAPQQPVLYPSPDGDTPRGGTHSSSSLISRANPSNYNSLARRFGVGAWVSVWNLGLGPSVEFYPLDNIGVMGTVGALFDYTSVSIRGMYLLPSLFELGAGYPVRPYVGAGYVHLWGPEVTLFGDTLAQDGDGFEVYGGALFSAEAVLKNLFVRAEFIYSNIDIDETLNGQTIDDGYSDYLDWSTFSLGVGISWLF